MSRRSPCTLWRFRLPQAQKAPVGRAVRSTYRLYPWCRPRCRIKPEFAGGRSRPFGQLLYHGTAPCPEESRKSRRDSPRQRRQNSSLLAVSAEGLLSASMNSSRPALAGRHSLRWEGSAGPKWNSSTESTSTSMVLSTWGKCTSCSISANPSSTAASRKPAICPVS